MKIKRVRLLLSLCVLVLVLLAVAPGAIAQDSPISIKVGYSVWVGYGPLFIARDQGYFEEQGLDVELVNVEKPSDRFTALAGKQLDGLVTTLDTTTQYWTEEAPFKVILGLDESSGGDGIVAGPSIESVADLAGKSVGVNVGSVSQFFLAYVLQENDMSTDDLTVVNMEQGDVPAALAANRIDAGVTWEPHLSRAVDNGAKLLVSSKDTPGIIVDIMVLRDDVIESNPEIATGLVNAWYQAIEYWKANPDDAATMMAKGLGSFYDSADAVNADLAGVTLFDEEKNQSFFAEPEEGTEEATAVSTLQFAIDFYTGIEVITTQLNPADMIDSSFVLPEGTPEATPETTPESSG